MQVGYWRSVAVGGYFHRSEFGTEDGSAVLLAGGYPSRQQHYNKKVSAELLKQQTRGLNVCVFSLCYFVRECRSYVMIMCDHLCLCMFVFEYVYVFLHVQRQGWCPQMVCKEIASLFLLNKKKTLHLKHEGRNE